MKMITFVYSDGMELTWRVKSASHGHNSRNVVLYNAISPKGIKTALALIPLAGVVAVLEDDEDRG